MTDSSQLTLVPLSDFDMVPVHLLEQVKGRNWEPEKLKEWGPIIGKNPMQRIFGMTGPDKAIHGVVWATVSPVADGIVLQVVSVDPEYQDGKVMRRVRGAFEQILSELGLTRLYAMTTRVRAGERLGWRRTGQELMEV